MRSPTFRPRPNRLPARRRRAVAECRCTAGTTPGVEAHLLDELWRLADDWHNAYVPVTRAKYDLPTESGKVRVYDDPATPIERTLAAGELETGVVEALAAVEQRVDVVALGPRADAIVGALGRLDARRADDRIAVVQ